MKIAFTVQYNGKKFLGFQKQKKSHADESRTVQEELEKALTIFFRQEIKIYAAGRTDRGVSALGQVIHFQLHKHDGAELNFAQIAYSLNSILPQEISVSHGKIVPQDFHARFSCLQREYVYFVYNSPVRSAIFSAYSLWVSQPLNVEAMRKAGAIFLGEKDFAAFTPVVYLKKKEKTIRRIDEISILKKNNFLVFYFRGSGFLHNMVRIITGTLIDVGKEKLSSADIEKILFSKDRTKAGKTLPPHPLFFLSAKYHDYSSQQEIDFPIL